MPSRATTGSTSAAGPSKGVYRRQRIAAEGVYQVINMTGNGATDSFEIPVTDGQQMLPKFVDADSFDVRNMASGGQIARGFRSNGQLEAILQYIKPGDYFLLEMGINDTAAKNSTTEEQFKEIMRDMVRQVRATGATPVLVTPQGRATDFNADGVHSSVNRWYRHSTIALAQEEGVPLADLNVLSSSYFTSIGPEATLALYMKGDALHPNRAGATELARLVAEDLQRQGLPVVQGLS
jgi:lysophospholipase L1-like esterase